MKIDKDSPIPLYYQISERIAERVRSGELPVGSRVPSERILCEEFGVSRMTIRQAISYLRNQGLLTVRRGAGMFVAVPKVLHDTLHVSGFQSEVIRQGGTVSSKVLTQEVVTVPDFVSQNLRLNSTAKVIKIVRLRCAWGEPLLLERIYLPKAICPKLEKQDLSSASLYVILSSEYGVRLVRASQSFEATLPDQYEQTLFEIGANIPLILSRSVAYSDRDVPVEYAIALYRGDRFRFFSESANEESRKGLSLEINLDGMPTRRDHN